jgi:peptidoglycan/xylan/chitin deacetylase (PgdA/CDA1 family)
VSLHPGKHTRDLSQPVVAAFPVPQTYQQETATTAQQFMTALLNHQYATMWTMLHPQVQAVWPGKAAYISYWQTRFQDYTLQRFVLGKARWLDQWVNPETMIAYNQVIEVPTSLLLEPGQAIQLQSQAPPEDLHPDQVFQNLPFIVQQVPAADKAKKSRWLILAGGPADLEASILPPVQSASTAVQVPILMYHHISDVVPPTSLGTSLTITPTFFGQQLDYLQKRGYHTITFNQLFDALYYGGPLPSHPIILTFDDGYDDAFHFAFPRLKAHGFSGMFYIITGKVGWSAYLNWKQIRTMLKGGMQIGSHTIHHVDMGSLVLYSQDLAQQELQKSQEALQNHLGTVIQQFCYPSGEPFNHGSLAARQQIVSLLASDGYVGATTDPGMTGTYQNSTDPFVLLRIRVDGRSDLQFFMDSLPW